MQISSPTSILFEFCNLWRVSIVAKKGFSKTASNNCAKLSIHQSKLCFNMSCEITLTELHELLLNSSLKQYKASTADGTVRNSKVCLCIDISVVIIELKWYLLGCTKSTRCEFNQKKWSGFNLQSCDLLCGFTNSSNTCYISLLA